MDMVGDRGSINMLKEPMELGRNKIEGPSGIFLYFTSMSQLICCDKFIAGFQRLVCFS